MYDAEPGVEQLMKEEASFWIFFPVVDFLKSGVIRKVGSFSVPEYSEEMPIFRTGVPNLDTGKVDVWWL